MILAASGLLTGYLYLRIEYGSVSAFREAMQRRWLWAAENETVLRFQSFRGSVLPAMQEALNQRNLDGWILWDNRRSRTWVYELLPLFVDRDSFSKSAVPQEGQREFLQPFLYYIPSAGNPFKLVHPIDAGLMQGLPGLESFYLNRQDWDRVLKKSLSGVHRVAADDPHDSWVAAPLDGTGVEIVSSSELAPLFLARLSSVQAEQHRRAARHLSELIPLAFNEIKGHVEASQPITVGQLKKFLLVQIDRVALRTESIPLVSTGRATATPYFSPTYLDNTLIQPGDVIVLEVAARMDEPGSVYAKAAWTGFVGRSVPPEVEQRFSVCAGTRDAVLQAIRAAVKEKRTMTGQEAQQAAGGFLARKGMENACPHPVGFSLGRTLFGPGANLDALLLPDARPLLSDTAFSVEPGIYAADFGVRSAVSVLLLSGELAITTWPVQDQVVPILQ